MRLLTCRCLVALTILCSLTIKTTVGAFPLTGGSYNSQSTSASMTVKQRKRPSPSVSTSLLTRGGGGTTHSTSQLSALPPSVVVFDNAPLWASQQITLALNLLGFVISLTTGSHLHLDLLGTGAFFVSVLPALALAKTNARITYSCGAVALWSVKLTAFLFYRALVVKNDARLESTLSTPSGTFGFWAISALWGIVTMLPHALGTTNAVQAGTTVTTVAGMTLFASGWLIETVADLQKWAFKQQNPGAFCNVGLWRWSQHPNWFGNLVLWSGILILNLPALLEPTPEKAGIWAQIWAWRRVGLACLSPLLLWTLFSGQANGSITDSVNMANSRYGYGTDPVFTEYIDSTPLLIPTKIPQNSP